MKISRRNFIVAAPVIAGAVLGLKSVVFGQKAATRGGLYEIPEMAATDTLSKLSWASFYPYQNTEFTFRSGEEDVPLTLAAMVDTKPQNLERIRTKKGECFILKFIGSARLPLTQGTYDVNHFLLGDFRLFITEGGRVKRNNYYIAVINRVVS